MTPNQDHWRGSVWGPERVRRGEVGARRTRKKAVLFSAMCQLATRLAPLPIAGEGLGRGAAAPDLTLHPSPPTPLPQGERGADTSH